MPKLSSYTTLLAASGYSIPLFNSGVNNYSISPSSLISGAFLFSGNSGKLMATNGVGVVFANSSSLTIGGSDTYVQFNSGGNFGGSINFKFNESSGSVQIGNPSTINSWERLFLNGTDSTGSGISLVINNENTNKLTSFAKIIFRTSGNIENGQIIASTRDSAAASGLINGLTFRPGQATQDVALSAGNSVAGQALGPAIIVKHDTRTVLGNTANWIASFPETSQLEIHPVSGSFTNLMLHRHSGQTANMFVVRSGTTDWVYINNSGRLFADYVTINSGINILGSHTGILPDQTSNSGKVLATDGASTLWVAQGASQPGGSNTHIQFNSGGSLSGKSTFSFDYNNNAASLTGTLYVDNIIVNSSISGAAYTWPMVYGWSFPSGVISGTGTNVSYEIPILTDCILQSGGYSQIRAKVAGSGHVSGFMVDINYNGTSIWNTVQGFRLNMPNNARSGNQSNFGYSGVLERGGYLSLDFDFCPTGILAQDVVIELMTMSRKM